jgi:conjugal transfer/entry exclusion protein
MAALVVVAAAKFGTGILVIDVSNLAQNVVTAMKQLSTYAQQVQQYQLQL